MKSQERRPRWVTIGLMAVATVIGCSSSPDKSNGTVDEQKVVADNATPQTVRVGKRVSVEIDIPANVLPRRQPLTITVRTDVVRKGATPVGSSVEFQPAGLTFNGVVRVRQPLPTPPPMRRYAAFQSLPDTDIWVRRAPGRKLPTVDPLALTEVWELDADTSGLWVFAQEDVPASVPVIEPTPDAAATADTAPLPVATPAALMVNTSFVDFGNIVIGTRAQATLITVVNTGELPSGRITLSLTGEPLGGFAFLDLSLCDGADLPSGGTCVVRVIAEPKQVVNAAGILSIVSATGAMASVSFAVTGIKPPQLVAKVAQLGFKPAPVDATAETLQLVLSNDGDLASGPIAFALKGPDAASFRIDAGTCVKPLTKSEVCTVNITMIAAKIGDLTATIEATAGPGGTAVVDLLGTGLSAANGAKLVFAVPTATMGSDVYFKEFSIGACSSSLVEFTVANQGQYTSEAVVITLSGPQASDYAAVASGDTCSGKRLAIDETCTFTLKVCSNVYGDHRATVTVSAKASTQSATASMYAYSS